MGITEYVSSIHTFGVLICAKNNDICATVARRIQWSIPQFCGLYTYNSISASEVDPLYAFVARQYRAVLWLRAGTDAILMVSNGPVAAALVRGLKHYGARVVTERDTETTIFMPRTLLDSADTRNEFADYVATVLQGVS